jgi:hypothetical protein
MSKTKKTIWEQVERTNPDNTKPVGFGRGFTAIDAYSQIQKATEIFGPVGIGWGWDTAWDKSDGVVFAETTLWYKWEGETGKVTADGSAALMTKGGKVDDDAHKKARTDSITKGLSFLGFNADVFLGRFDDNKYVEQLKEDFAPKVDDTLAALKKSINACESLDALRLIWKDNKENMAAVSAEIEAAQARLAA